jgi:hypothetical protein
MALTKITTGLIAANTLATANIADNSVDATKIASNSILTRHIDDDQVTGDQLADNITIAGNLTITGNLTTNGSTVTNSSSNTTIEDAIIELGTGTSGAPATDAGIVIERGSSDNVFIGWDESADKVIVGTGSFTGASTGNLTITAAPLVTGALTASGLSFPTSDGSAGQVISTDGSGALSFADNTTKVDNYTATGNGSTTAFDTGINPGNEVNTWIFIDGVYQQKSQYSYSGSTVTFSTAPENGALIDVITGTSSNITASDTVLGVYEATTSNTDAYSTGISAANENNTWVFVGGVYQPKDSYTFSSGTLTFDANTPTGQKLSVVATKTLTAGTVDTASLAANAISSAKIASNAILSRHIVNNSIVGADISATTQITASTFTGALTGNVTGNVAGNLTGTILTAAQTNITSVGTLSAATISGQLTAGGLAYPTSDGNADQVLKTDGSGAISFGTVSGTTLNNNTNNYVMTGTGSANTLNGEANLTFDGSTLAVTGALTASTGVVVQGSGTTAGVYLNGTNSDTATQGNFVRYGTNFATQSNADNSLLITKAFNGSTFLDAFTVKSDGKVGIGATTIDEKLHIEVSSGDAAIKLEDASGDYIRIDQNSVGANDKIRFKSGSSLTERMRISSNGRVSIGHTASTEAQLHVKDSTTAVWLAKLENASAGDGLLITSTTTSATQQLFNVRGNTSTNYMKLNGRGSLCIGSNSSSGCIEPSGLNSGSYQGITFNSPNVSSPRHNYSWSNGLYWWNGSNEGSLNNAGTWTNGSDIAFKKNVADIEYGLSTVLDLQPRKYQMKIDDANDIGFIAQEMETVIPEIVHTNANNGYKSLDYGAITAVLVKAVQEQQTIIDDLKSRIETLEE